MRIPIIFGGGVLLLTATAAFTQVGPAIGTGRGQGPMMSRMDVNGDGFVSAAEHRQWAGKVFATMDVNKDGKLSREEYLAVHMGPGPRRGGNPAQMQAMREQADARKVEQFSAMDTDRNGFVARAEFLARSERDFTAKDTDKDGKLSANEFRAWRAPW
jgi:Ca2+-binding EF-hand superfamily protein